jgi:lactoylglutathione lyase
VVPYVSGVGQLKIGLRVRNLDRSVALYRRLGFKEVPNNEKSQRLLAFGDAWLVLSERSAKGDHPDERGERLKNSTPGSGVVLTIPTHDLNALLGYWTEEGMLVISALVPGEPDRAFHGLDPDGYELRFEEIPEN